MSETRLAVDPTGSRPAAAARSSVTIVHISDIQFGKNHRFGRGKLEDHEGYDVLLERLKDDFDRLRDEGHLPADLVALTGDLTEWGMPGEFAEVEKFARGIAKHLTLDASRVLVIPGNHDVNRKACEAYFNQCAADDGREPAAPFSPKWNAYAAFFARFYGDACPHRFTEQEPYSFFEVKDLRVVVAGLNSTMRESHQPDDHYGWLGEAQLKHFKSILASYRREGWLRIGLVHHNAQRGAQSDDENLRDAQDLERILASELNLLLHGHTHQGRVGWLGKSLPVLCTGSAGVSKEFRPGEGEVPNQYQLIRIGPKHLWLGMRQYAPEQKRWIGDTRASDGGGAWYHEEEIDFRDTTGTFAKALGGVSASVASDEPSDLLRRSTELRGSGRIDDALAAAVKAAAVFESRKDRDGAALARLEQVETHLRAGRLDGIAALLDEAQAGLSAGPSVPQARLYNVLGSFQYRSLKHDEAESSFATALKRAIAVPHNGEAGRAHLGLGRVKHMKAAYEEARTHFVQAEELFALAKENLWVGAALIDRGTLEFKQDNLGLATELLQRGRDLSHQEGDALAEARALVVLGHMAREASSGEAEWIYRKAAELAAGAGAPLQEAHARLGLAATLANDRPVEAANAFRSARDIYRRLREALGEMNSLNGLGFALRLSGTPAEAITAHQEALDLAPQTKNSRARANALRGLGQAKRDLGQADEARNFLTQARNIYETIDERHGLADTLLAFALLDARCGQPGVEATFEAALKASRDLRDRAAEAECLAEFGSYRASSDIEHAKQLLYQAALLLQHQGATRRAEDLLTKARGLGSAVAAP
jgi:3',5'-cyclic AMP phosphodiesterase CpdA